MIALSLSGALPEFKTFESEISTSAIRALPITGMNSLSFVKENLAFAKERGATEIADALRANIADFEAKKKAKATGAATAKLETSMANLETKLERRLSRLEVKQERRLSRVEQNLSKAKDRAIAAEKSANNLQKLLPIRSWKKISNLKYGK